MKHAKCAVHSRLLTGVGAAALVLVAAGCVSTPPPSESFPVATQPDVILEPGDVLKFQFTYWPELNDEQMVRPDGKVSLQLVGEVGAQGLTPENLRSQLLSAYKDKIKDPEINVVVTAFASQRVYVGGEVRSPGVLPLQGRMTMLAAILQAGGPNKGSAKMSSVVIIRQRDGKQYARSVDLRQSLKNPESEMIYLEPYDIVYVPQTAIDRADLFVDQYINRIIPRNVYLNFTKNLSDTNYSGGRTLQMSPTNWLSTSTSF